MQIAALKKKTIISVIAFDFANDILLSLIRSGELGTISHI